MEKLARLAPIAVSLLISALAYGAQVLFYYTEPSPLDFQEAVTFNLFIGCIWISYARTCSTNPGHVPANWIQASSDYEKGDSDATTAPLTRWCKKCDRPKPPRAHHCKSCQRYDLSVIP